LSFDKFNLHEEVLNGLRDMGFEKPTPIQEACISLIMEGRDILASAQTGTGKTAAFAIPVLEKLSEKRKQGEKGIRALIITPTRELAGQVDEAFFAIGYHTGLSTAKVYGGDDWSRQEKALNRGTSIIVATPGRLLDHMKIHDVDFSNLDFLILDEADRMLDMGFIPDITQIVSSLPKERQTLLFSATMPQKIAQLAQKMMNNPERVNMAPSNKAAEGVTQGMYYVEERDKLPLVLHLFETEKWPSAIIFMSTKRAVDKLTRELTRKGASVTSIHGDRTQAERERALESFRKGEFRIIVATDVMARGIDVEGISHIINFSVPHDVEDYVHRIGRTARAESTGDAITLVSGQDRRYMENIIRAMDSKIAKLEVPDIVGKKERPEGKDQGGRSRQKSRDGGSRNKPGRPKQDSAGSDKKEPVAGKKDPETDKKEPVAGKPKSAQKGPKDAAAKSGKPEKAPSDAEARQQASGGDKDTDERPKRRRGRKRPGGNRGPGKGSRSSEGKKQDGEKSGKQPAREAAADDGAKGRQDTRGGKGGRGRGPAKGEQGSTPGKGGGRRRAPQRGKGSAPDKSGSGRKQKPSGKEAERKELFDNITSPNMERVNKAVGKKRGVWSKIKNLLGGE